jgi:hypothetical protein
MALPEPPETIDAVGYGLLLVHEDVRALRETVTGHDARFDAVDQSLADLRRLLIEILGRLPAAEWALSHHDSGASSHVRARLCADN